MTGPLSDSSWAEPPAMTPTELPAMSGMELPAMSGTELPAMSGTELPARSGMELPTVTGALTAPLPVECLFCFVWRMLDTFGCNATLRWARHWRDARAPRATSLERRLARAGGLCDCEIFLNGWELASRSRARGIASTEATAEVCTGVRRGSTQPCARWVRRSGIH
jgi:hypothetical protein